MVAIAAPCPVPPGVHQFVSDGVNRKYMLTGAGNRYSRLSVSMHGGTGSSEGQHKTAGFSEVGGGIAVYPQATGVQPGTLWKAYSNSKDVRYVIRLTTWLHSKGCGSPATTQFSGYSMGAMMTSRLACDAPNIARSYGMVAGALPLYCKLGKDKIVTIVHGRDDKVVGWNGEMSLFLNSLINGNGIFIPKTTLANDWQRAKGCKPTVVKKRIDPVTVLTTYSCPGTANTVLVAHTGAHWWDSDPRYSRLSTTRLFLSR